MTDEQAATGSGYGSSSGEDDSSSEEEAEEDEKEAFAEEIVPHKQYRTKFFKGGDYCCDIIAEFVKGSLKIGKLPAKVNIDQRAKFDRCQVHMLEVCQEGGFAIWRMKLANADARSSYKTLCDYFIGKDRIGLVETPTYDIYIVPPHDPWTMAFGLGKVNEVIGLQVPKIPKDET